VEAGRLGSQRDQTKQRAAKDYTLGGALKTWQWWALWALLFLNTSAGISLISQESPMFQEIAKVSAVVAAGMVGIASIGNAVGRIFWAWTPMQSPGDGPS
jgi:MFS transporter, OFA family, oxalate/formate antiporter